MKNTFVCFNKFEELFIPHNIVTTKKYNTGLQKEALEWWKEQFKAIFGSTTSVDTKLDITWHYSCGLLMFGVPPLGDYYYKFIIKAIHFEYWNTREWQVGFKYGQYCSKSKMKLRNDNYRDGNPYKDFNFYSSTAWDAGYVMGLFNYKFFKHRQS